ncbi:MAG: hypothetical protein ACK4L7_06575 [Flavobacteriales bacterium]
MKTPFIAVCAALLALAASAQQPVSAQSRQPQQVTAKPMPPQARPQDMAKELGLTDQQVEDLNRIDREHQERMKQLHREGGTPEQKRAKTVELRDRKQAELKKVMSAEQWAKWQQMKQGQRDASMRAREEQRRNKEQPQERKEKQVEEGKPEHQE